MVLDSGCCFALMKMRAVDYGDTIANRRNAEQDQFDVCVEARAFRANNGQELCTSRLKTGLFMKWLSLNVPEKDAVIYYGFDANEQRRIQRRSRIKWSQEEQQWPEHISSPDCWCEPELEYKDPETGAEVWVHRSMQ